MKPLDIPEKLYYSISEVSNLFNVNKSKLRFWEKEFKILSPQRTRKGIRQYTYDDLKKIQLIDHLLNDKGYTIKGAETIIKEKFKNSVSKVSIIDKLLEIKKTLLEIKNNL